MILNCAAPTSDETAPKPPQKPLPTLAQRPDAPGGSLERLKEQLDAETGTNSIVVWQQRALIAEAAYTSATFSLQEEKERAQRKKAEATYWREKFIYTEVQRQELLRRINDGEQRQPQQQRAPGPDTSSGRQST